MLDNSGNDNWTSDVKQIARADFDAALRKGFWRSMVSWITQSNNELLPFEVVQKNLPLAGQHALGVRTIPTEQIVGSVSRYHDFDRAFLPRQSRTQNRWMSIDSAVLQDVILPPIQVYKIGKMYFVKDGNHRVSVAKEKGQSFIDADVIEIDLPIEMDTVTDIDTLIQKVEELEFEKQAHLHRLRPEADIRFTVPGGYQRLLEHIHVHQWYMGVERQAAVSWEEAVTGWYDDVYLPLVVVIREYHVLQEFPHRTEADLYLWIIEHLYYLREDWKKDVSLETAATHFTDLYSQRPLRYLLNLIRRTVRVITDREEERTGG
ncbi:MAG: transcriptional regulator [Chloroflexi bacterium]|nr:hypothetical protein [Anaerolineaceae bacterium]NMB87862.1 transcriptional regulator [Chloroflexota bacterium]